MRRLEIGFTWPKLGILAIVVLFAFLGSRGLNEPDEGRYAEIGREMAVSGSWLVPHLNGFEHFQKPPLLYWMTAAAIRVGGANEWAARLPSALAALGTVLLTAWMGRMLFSKQIGIFAGLILLSSAGFFILARVLTADMLLTFWITAVLACYLRFLRDGKSWWAYLCFTALGFGFLTKGPMALIVPFSAIIAHRLRVRGERVAPLPWKRGLALTLLISLSWFVALSLWRHDLFDYFWRYELVERFTSSAHGRSKPWWFFAPVIAVASVPWVFLLPALVKRAWQLVRQGTLPAAGWFLMGWMVPPIVVLSLSGSKLPTYILPLLPGLALGFSWIADRLAIRPLTIMAVGFAMLVVCLGGAAVFPMLNDRVGQQATVRDLVRAAAQNPDLRTSNFYAVEVRAHGLEFYLQRLVTATREQADIVLPPTWEQQQRLLSTVKFDASSILPARGQPAVAVLTRRHRASASFLPGQWREIGRAGDFVMLESVAEVSATQQNEP